MTPCPDVALPTCAGTTRVAASVALRDLVRGPTRTVRVISAFPAAVYLAHDRGTVALVASDGVVPPNALVVPAPTGAHPFTGLHVHTPGTVGGGAVTVAGRHLTVTRWFDPVPRLVRTDAPQLRARARTARAHLASRSGPVPALLAAGVADVAEALLRDDRDAAVGAAGGLVGLGPGLTPAGDDVLAGLLAATLALDRALHGRADTRLRATTRLAGSAIADLAHDATTAVSAALLHHAARGEVAAPVVAVLHALTGRGALDGALGRLLAVGATSGRDLAVGILAGCELTTTVPGTVVCPRHLARAAHP